MSYESDECKLLIDEAIHDYLHDDTENEMAVKDWFYDLRKQAAKASEYEAKAKAFDRIVEERNRIGKLMHNKEYPQVFTDEAFWNIDDIIIDTESGEYDA